MERAPLGRPFRFGSTALRGFHEGRFSPSPGPFLNRILTAHHGGDNLVRVGALAASGVGGACPPNGPAGTGGGSALAEVLGGPRQTPLNSLIHSDLSD